MKAQARAVDLLLQAIRDRGWGQNGTERILGLTQGSISRFREGKRPGAVSQEIIERVLGVPRSAWWTEEERNKIAKCVEAAGRLSGEDGRRAASRENAA